MLAPDDAPAEAAPAELTHTVEEHDTPTDDDAGPEAATDEGEEPYLPTLTLTIDEWTSPNHGHFTSLVARLEDKDAQVNVSTTLYL